MAGKWKRGKPDYLIQHVMWRMLVDDFDPKELISASKIMEKQFIRDEQETETKQDI